MYLVMSLRQHCVAPSALPVAQKEALTVNLCRRCVIHVCCFDLRFREAEVHAYPPARAVPGAG